jgi:predicted kinase
MRKWMRERLKRRKKVAEPTSGEPAQTPLQPAYFDAHVPATEATRPEPEADAPSSEAEPAIDAQQKESQSPAQARAADESRRRRRRRGGRGRGRGTGQPAESSPRPAAAEAPAAPAVPQVAAAPRAPKGTVVLAIGLPGSGKSSWFKRNRITPLSSDMLRTLLFDDATEQRFQDLVFSNLRSMLKARLIARRPMNYVDATNLTPHERHSWIKLAHDFGYEVQAVYFDVPVEVCLERNRRRDRTVDEGVMRRMAEKLKPPTFEEGFAKITLVRVKAKP